MAAFPVEFTDLFGDTLLAEILARDTALGPDYRVLNVDQADRRILPAMTDLTLGPDDEPQHSGAVVAVNYGDYDRQEIWVCSGANIGAWYCLGGEFGFPKVWLDRRGSSEKMLDRGPAPRPGPNEIRQHPRWEDVLARGPVTLLTAGDQESYRAGWRNGRRRMVEQMETVADDDD